MESIPDTETPILVVDDEVDFLVSTKLTLLSVDIPEPALLSDSSRVMELLRERDFQLVLLDLAMPSVSGIEILRQMKEEFPGIECVVITAIDEVAFAVQAMKFGAFDYLVKPIDNEKLIIAINRALERYNLRQELSLFERIQSFSDLRNPSAFRNMVAEDTKMALVFHQAESAAATDYNLLITGETGTGKELLAKTIHTISQRAKGPFVAVNVGASSRNLFEDDFFGHTKGAYTGAFTEKKGFFETAQGGSLFLDEVGELAPELQVKLLRVIEEKELYRLGSVESKNIDVRIIAATNRDIKDEIDRGHFRNDLFYRLNMFHIAIPPLRERKKDILPLSQHFSKIHAGKNKKDIQSISPDFAGRLMGYNFPGNVRELEHIIASAVLLEKGRVSKPSLKQHDELLPLSEVEKRHLLKVLEVTGGNRTQAAKILGIGLRTLYRRLDAFQNTETMPK